MRCWEVAAAPGLHPRCGGFGFFSSEESHLLIFWAAFPSVLPGGGRALEISIVAGGGCFEWFPSVNQIPQNTERIQGWGWGFFGVRGFFLPSPNGNVTL